MSAVTTPPLALPSFRHIEAALRVTTERLARELQTPEPAAPDWSDFDWAVARAVSTMQGTSGLLANTLRWHGPESWRRHLVEQRTQCAARDVRIRARLEELDAAARKTGIALVALKGSSLLAHHLYGPGERPMGDIDLLAREADLDVLNAQLLRLGYAPPLRTRRHLTYLPSTGAGLRAFAEHADNPLKIEVHTRVAEALPVTEIDITARLWPADAPPGLNAYRSRGMLLLHFALHASGNMRARALRQVQLVDLARLGTLLTGDEWEEVFGGRESWWLAAPLQLVARYFPGSLPGESLARATSACPAWLRAHTRRTTLAEVSWSRLGIEAFPGIEWSRSPLEALRFMRSRLLPGRVALGELEVFQQSLPWLRELRWYDASHAERIARWILGQRVRVQTFLQVRAALGAPPAGITSQ